MKPFLIKKINKKKIEDKDMNKLKISKKVKFLMN